MGYDTEYAGKLVLEHMDLERLRKVEEVLEGLRSRQLGNYDTAIINNTTVWININAKTKNYDQDIEGAIKKILEIDPSAMGTINCQGEDLNDSYKLEIIRGSLYKIPIRVLPVEGNPEKI